MESLEPPAPTWRLPRPFPRPSASTLHNPPTSQEYTTPARKILRDVFGFHEFRGRQEEIVTHVIGGGSALVLMPTGGGKSLCYQVPALVRDGTTVVISPLISLMKDQVDALRAWGVRAAAWHSGLDAGEAADTRRAIRQGSLDLLYISPERLLSQGLDLIADAPLALFAVDEAHCVSQWGHDFRPEYEGLRVLRERFPQVPLLALTATADPHTRSDIRRVLGLGDCPVFVSSFDRPNIRYTVARKQDWRQQIIDFLRERREDSGIVYALSRRRTEDIASFLREAGLAVDHYHAGRTAEERARVQERFQRDELQVVVATVAFGMGIDKSNVRFVVHADMPMSVEGYYQETGRAGRDGLPSEALLLHSMRDAVLARQLVEKSENPEQRIIAARKVGAMVAYCESTACRRQALLHYFGEQLPEPCGNCDVCLDPPETWDATTEARMALSCVFRVGQRFGVRHVIDVLRGSSKASVKRHGHHTLSTWGIGKAIPDETWEHVLYQLIHLGYLVQDIGQHNILLLTDRSRPLLQGEESLTLARPRPKPARQHRASPRGVSPKRTATSQPGLFQHLRALRKELAAELGVPPYIIFNDATLVAMADEAPEHRDDLLAISGVGPVKVERFGPAFLIAIREYREACPEDFQG